jgi:hypothetical protein
MLMAKRPPIIRLLTKLRVLERLGRSQERTTELPRAVWNSYKTPKAQKIGFLDLGGIAEVL